MTGKYNPSTGSSLESACLPCEAGKYTGVQGVSVCLQCLAGSYGPSAQLSVCNTCTPGKYSASNGLSVCTMCSIGTYWTGTGGSTVGVCQSCGIGTFSTSAGAVISATCDACPPGTYNGATGRSVCALCTPGKYNAGSGSIQEGACSSCIAGKFSTVSGAITENACRYCDPGYFAGSPGGATVCSICPAGKIGAGSGLSICEDCNAQSRNEYQNIPGQTACKPCNQTQCATGTFSQACTNSQDRQCIKCTPPTNCIYSPYTEGCFVPASALSGTPSCSCIKGFEMMPTNPVYTCVQCPPGKFKELWNNNPCRNWTTPAVLSCSTGGMYSTAGTRTSDSRCTMFPKPPVNAYTDGLGWSCNAGYEKV